MKQVTPEEIDRIVKVMTSYVINPTEENLKRIHENLPVIGESINWAKLYLATERGDGLRSYAVKLLNNAKILKAYMDVEKKMAILQKMDILNSPYSVYEQLKRNF